MGQVNAGLVSAEQLFQQYCNLHKATCYATDAHTNMAALLHSQKCTSVLKLAITQLGLNITASAMVSNIHRCTYNICTDIPICREEDIYIQHVWMCIYISIYIYREMYVYNLCGYTYGYDFMYVSYYVCVSCTAPATTAHTCLCRVSVTLTHECQYASC